MHDDEAGRVRALAEILREYELDAVRVRIGEIEYELVAREAAPAGAYLMAPGAALPAAAPAPAPVAGEPAPGGAAVAPANVKHVTAPVVGVYYSAPSPGAEPFVTVGARVVPGQVLCILEAMKLMNEITSEYAGVVNRVIPENGQLVSLGDDLFWIEP
jgi:acetyl-CoA carboxylase biotin carboxyl carrier protein